MVQLTCIYTKSGDFGKTSLGNGERVLKSSTRIDAIGTVDELNSFLGLALTQKMPEKIEALLTSIQNNLFDLGADLCMPDLDDHLDFKPLRITKEQVEKLESEIDTYNAYLSSLNSFVLPGGTKQSAYMHCLRTITRRAERIVCALHEDASKNSVLLMIAYLNRLSDLFFVLGRYLNNLGQDDILWKPGK
ncbi:MAG: Cobalamin adenosyltransferase [Holosporales bacterium]